MQKENFKKGSRYLIESESVTTYKNNEKVKGITEMEIMDISNKAIKIKHQYYAPEWLLIEEFQKMKWKIIEELPPLWD